MRRFQIKACCGKRDGHPLLKPCKVAEEMRSSFAGMRSTLEMAHLHLFTVQPRCIVAQSVTVNAELGRGESFGGTATTTAKCRKLGNMQLSVRLDTHSLQHSVSLTQPRQKL